VAAGLAHPEQRRGQTEPPAPRSEDGLDVERVGQARVDAHRRAVISGKFARALAPEEAAVELAGEPARFLALLVLTDEEWLPKLSSDNSCGLDIRPAARAVKVSV
jgi:hypothetical protein